MIFDGSIAAGEHLNESTLAAHFGTSRGPLREALQALGEQGLVSFTRNRGAFVRRLTTDEAEELYDLRAAALDDEVGRKLASTLRDETENGTLETLLRTMDKEAKAGDIPSLLSQQPALSRPPRHVRGGMAGAPPKSSHGA